MTNATTTKTNLPTSDIGIPSSGNLDDYLGRVAAIADIVREEAAAAEEQRTLSEPVVQALAEQELHWALVPEALGGGGLTVSELMLVCEELSRIDTSTGWAWMVPTWATAEIMGYLDPSVSEKLTSLPERFVLAGQLLPRHVAKRVEGGYLVEGDYSFGSGSDQATWMGAGIFAGDENGEMALNEHGHPTPLVAIMPKNQVEMKNNWDVWGLRATGSHDYRVDNVFVPDEHTIPIVGGSPKRSEVLAALTIEYTGGVAHIPIVLGAAAHALELVAAATKDKGRMHYQGPVGDSDLFRIEFGRKEALLQSARLYSYQLVGEAEAHVMNGNKVTPEMIARKNQLVSWLHEVTLDVIEFAHRWGGSKSIGSTSELGRVVRDMHVATQHVLVDPKIVADSAATLLPAYAERGATE